MVCDFGFVRWKSRQREPPGGAAPAPILLSRVAPPKAFPICVADLIGGPPMENSPARLPAPIR